MATDASLDVTVVGRRLRRRVLLALGLFGVLPVLVLAYAVHGYFFADVRSLSGINLFGLQSLVFFTLLAMVGGAWILWDIGRAVSRMGESLVHHLIVPPFVAGPEEVGALSSSFTGCFPPFDRTASTSNRATTAPNPPSKNLM